MTKRLAIVLLAGCALAVGCASAPQRKPVPSSGLGPGLGIVHHVEEMAHDGDFELKPDRQNEVDLDARLRVSFEVPTAEQAAEATPEWRALNDLLALARDLSEQRAALLATPAQLEDPGEAAAVIARAQALDRGALQLVVGLKAVPSVAAAPDPDLAAQNIFSGNGGDDVGYPAVSRWLTARLESLVDRANDFLKGREEVEVTVAAYIQPVIGEPRRVHVSNYDNIKSYDPEARTNPYRLLSRAERRRLQMEMEQTRIARAAIGEIVENGGDIKRSFHTLLQALEQRLETLREAIRSGPDVWLTQLDAAVAQLEAVPAGDAAKPAATRLAADLSAFAHDFRAMSSLEQGIEGFVRELRNPAGEELPADQVDPARVLTKLDDLLHQLEPIQTAVQAWGPRVQSMTEATASLASTPSGTLLPDELKAFVDEVQSTLPNTVRLVANAADFMQGGARIVAGADTLDGASDVSIRYGVDDLRDGVVDLATAGFTEGDQLQLEVRYTRKGTDEMKAVGSYNAVARRLGFHARPQIGAGLIFYRGTGSSNDDDKWRTNVAALAEWGYRYRDAQTAWPLFWNWIDPKLGTHVASLDQGSGAVEFGAGGNVSILHGLVFGGYGYNLSEDEQYFMVGLSLLSVLNEARSLTQKVETK